MHAASLVVLAGLWLIAATSASGGSGSATVTLSWADTAANAGSQRVDPTLESSTRSLIYINATAPTQPVLTSVDASSSNGALRWSTPIRSGPAGCSRVVIDAVN